MSKGFEILLGAVVALIVAGIVWLALKYFTRLEKYKMAWLTVAIASIIGILFINDSYSRATTLGDDLFSSILILIISSMVSVQVKIQDRKKK